MDGVTKFTRASFLLLAFASAADLAVISNAHGIELTPYVVAAANSRVEFEEASADQRKPVALQTVNKEPTVQLGISLVLGTDFGEVDMIDSITYTDNGKAIVDDNNAEDVAAMVYLHRRANQDCEGAEWCLGWGPYLGLLTKPSGRIGGGWSLGVMAGLNGGKGTIGVGYVVREDIRYLVTDNTTGSLRMEENDFEGFAVMIGVGF